MTCAPYLAIRVVLDVTDNAGSFPLIQRALRHHTNVEDICTGSNDLSEVLQLQRDLINVSGRTAFVLKKWASNVQAVYSEVPPENCNIEVKEFDDMLPSSLKLLGMVWTS